MIVAVEWPHVCVHVHVCCAYHGVSSGLLFACVHVHVRAVQAVLNTVGSGLVCVHMCACMLCLP